MSSTNPIQGTISSDVPLVNPPTDSVPLDDISQIVFAPPHPQLGPHLGVASWDGGVRVYEIGQGLTSQAKTKFQMTRPALGCTWNSVSLHPILILILILLSICTHPYPEPTPL